MLPSDKFECIQCGHCCINLWDAICTTVSEKDIEMWVDKKRYDILEWVEPLIVAGEEKFSWETRDKAVVAGYDIWINPNTKDDAERCPWLRKLPKKNNYICKIHDVKPEICREYPRSMEQAVETKCKGLKAEV